MGIIRLTSRRNPTSVVALALMLGAAVGLAWSTGPQAGPSKPAAAPAPVRRTLMVFAAASLNESLAEIGRQFEAQHPGVRVQFNLAGSQQLAQQLAQGAPADVLAAAAQKQMDQSVEAGRIQAGAAVMLARNRLAVIYPADNPAAIHGLIDLARTNVRLVLADAQVPAGHYSLELLDRAARNPALGPTFRDRVLANVVSYEENVRAVLVKVALGEGDAGIVYRSDVAAGQGDQVRVLDIPPALNPVAVYWIAPLADSRQPALAQAFISLAVSAEGQRILARYGFEPLADATAP
jgi:molybdate transport system substrate-binding protein